MKRKCFICKHSGVHSALCLSTVNILSTLKYTAHSESVHSHSGFFMVEHYTPNQRPQKRKEKKSVELKFPQPVSSLHCSYTKWIWNKNDPSYPKFLIAPFQLCCTYHSHSSESEHFHCMWCVSGLVRQKYKQVNFCQSRSHFKEGLCKICTLI